MATTKITQVGKRIVNDSSLIFYYDMSNTIRSFKGAPTTNLFAEDSDGVGGINRPPSATADFSQWDFTGTTYTEYLPNREVKIQENSTSTASRYLLLNSRCLASKDYTFSAYFKPLERKHIQIAPSTNFPQGSYANYTLEGEGTITGPGAAKATIKLMKAGSYTGWYRCTYTEISNATNSNNSRFALSLADTDSLTRLAAYAATSGYGVLIRDPQFEQSSFATSFVDGTRSNTQAIIDLTGNETVTANSVTYNSDGTFRFDNGDYITLPNAATTFGTGSVSTSVEFWVRPIDDTDTTRIPVGHQNVNDQRFYIGIIGSQWDVGWGNFAWDAGYTGTRPTVDYDVYQHICVTINAGVVSLYKNGVKSTFSKTDTTVNQSGVFPIGTYFAGGSPSGAYYGIDDIPIFRIYSRALSEAEVKQNFIAHRKQFGL
jgi:hypothetical protein